MIQPWSSNVKTHILLIKIECLYVSFPLINITFFLSRTHTLPSLLICLFFLPFPAKNEKKCLFSPHSLLIRIYSPPLLPQQGKAGPAGKAVLWCVRVCGLNLNADCCSCPSPCLADIPAPVSGTKTMTPTTPTTTMAAAASEHNNNTTARRRSRSENEGEGEGNNEEGDDSGRTGTSACVMLDKLPNRGHFISSGGGGGGGGGGGVRSLVLNQGYMKPYLCDHPSEPPGNQTIKTDQQNILIRSLVLRKKAEKEVVKQQQQQLNNNIHSGGSSGSGSGRNKKRKGKALPSSSSREQEKCASQSQSQSQAAAGGSKLKRLKEDKDSGKGKRGGGSGVKKYTSLANLEKLSKEELKGILRQYGMEEDRMKGLKKSDLAHAVLHFFDD